MIPVFLEYFFPYVLAICFIITVHEFGHYIAARLCGVKVRVFSIGFGPELYGITSSLGTRWKISLIPLGGYVSFVESKDDNHSFKNVNAWKKMMISLAGPFANWITAILIFIFIVYNSPMPMIDPVVSDVISGSPADIAGIKSKDRLLSIDGLKISNIRDVHSYLNTNLSKEIKIILYRSNVGEITVKIIPQTKYIVNNFDIKNSVLSIGVNFDSSVIHYQYRSISESILKGLNYSFDLMRSNVIALRDILHGKVKSSQIIGPIAIIKIAKNVASEGFKSYIDFVAVLSLSVCFFNLLPIPLLDGWNCWVFLLEMIRGKSIGKLAEMIIMIIGLFIVITSFVLIIGNDIYRLIS
ncbi:M50 family metallopeptidase [Candidatus Liberibacter americanus]|uniref:Putative membrane-associated Zn-dependent protease 1 n=1 Tax=Candidatus Liberibacter americanus str. Sao Paulo TaxID=1261131 RepID=U6B6Q9_9HYPH|nr:M50 family metallopeptidase [Candidatus Liberibacter americanus]AHA27561.1 putative membrane-associated Zn-dependent protease 1 [Candidatus Liberibacter americanus str. Sao Paulo]EMS36478.1 zinc metallopeptidase [Candidatus Liberibacter americanus PW_SP]